MSSTTAEDLMRFVQANIDPGPLGAAPSRAVAATHVGYFRAGGLDARPRLGTIHLAAPA